MASHRAEIVVPTLLSNGRIITASAIQRARAIASARMTEMFGGTTQAPSWGSYRHEPEAGGHMVDEEVVVVSSFVRHEAFTPQNKERMAALAREIATALDQECVLYVWDNDPFFEKPTGTSRTAISTVPFRNLPPVQRRWLLPLRWSRVASASDVLPLLQLDGWRLPTEGEHADIPSGTQLIAIHPTSGAHPLRALHRIANCPLPPNSELRDGDLVWEDRPGEIALYTFQERLRGPRVLPLSGTSGATKTVPMVVLQSLLRAKDVPPLHELLDRAALTGRFFRDYRAVHQRLAAAFEAAPLPAPEANREAQLLLGRLMVLQFLERRGWFGRGTGTLTALFDRHQGNFLSSTLSPLFSTLLAVPEKERCGHKEWVERHGLPSKKIPFLNGGLFTKRSTYTCCLPDNLFDPAERGSVLNLLHRYEFEVDDAAAESIHAIDPSIFGLVLESLAGEQERKTAGIHYTPDVIARTLALQGIARALSRRFGFRFPELMTFHRTRGADGLTEVQVLELQEQLYRLRIVDPAVGSGSLLLSALEVLMEFSEAVASRMGQPLTRGTLAWSNVCRRFVRESLFGVDVDPLAVEIARLRLWLAVTLGDDIPRPLPDLGYNLGTGDSLIDDPADVAIRSSIPAQLPLAFTEADERAAEFRNAVRKYFDSNRLSPQTAHVHLADLDVAQSKYRSFILNMDDGSPFKATSLPNADETPSFPWRLHFQDVFSQEQGGFDVVIANPPYVRIQHLSETARKRYRTAYPDIIGKRNVDLYIPFVARGLDLLSPTGELAFIMPNFSRSQAAGPLRDFLGRKRAVDLWVDFTDVQVFDAATNYVALLFAHKKQGRAQSFEVRVVEEQKWPPQDLLTWLDRLPSGKAEYRGEGWWYTVTDANRKLLHTLDAVHHRLGEFFEIKVGIQTSADNVFLFEQSQDRRDDLIRVFSEALAEEVLLEADALRPCAKGSADIAGGGWRHTPRLVLWPYDPSGAVLSTGELKSRFPRTLSYLKSCRTVLEARQEGSLRIPQWYAFGRNQGTREASQPKVLVPSLLRGPAALLDSEGLIAFTASGKGGGGAYALIPNDHRLPLAWVHAVLLTQSLWAWIRLLGDPKQGGWRGVDKDLLLRIPIPLPRPGALEESARLLAELARVDHIAHQHVDGQLDDLIWAATSVDR